MTNLDAAHYRYMQDAEFHRMVYTLAIQATDLTALDKGEPMLAGFRAHQINVGVLAILQFLAATGQQHQRFTWQPTNTPCADHCDPAGLNRC